jgi:hypothetical protein
LIANLILLPLRAGANLSLCGVTLRSGTAQNHRPRRPLRCRFDGLDVGIKQEPYFAGSLTATAIVVTPAMLIGPTLEQRDRANAFQPSKPADDGIFGDVGIT